MTNENYLLRDEADRIAELEADNERLKRIEFAWDEWQEKTEWVQKTAQASELGKHRADVLRIRLEKAESQASYEFSERELATLQRDEAWEREAKYKGQRDKLLKALKMWLELDGSFNSCPDKFLAEMASEGGYSAPIARAVLASREALAEAKKK